MQSRTSNRDYSLSTLGRHRNPPVVLVDPSPIIFPGCSEAYRGISRYSGTLSLSAIPFGHLHPLSPRQVAQGSIETGEKRGATQSWIHTIASGSRRRSRLIAFDLALSFIRARRGNGGETKASVMPICPPLSLTPSRHARNP